MTVQVWFEHEDPSGNIEWVLKLPPELEQYRALPWVKTHGDW